jgi:hypothetical protein
VTAVHRRAARREQQLADALGVERVKRRPRFKRAPDVAPMRHGPHVLQGDSKSRKRLPAWLWAAVEQAANYTPNAIPLVALFELGNPEGLCVLRLADLCALLGLTPLALGEQMPLARSSP